MEKEKCNKYCPKKFNDETVIDAHGYPMDRRWDTGRFAQNKGVTLDNRFVVPYNRTLFIKYQMHINVEFCNHSQSIKYLFKYINKGSDRATVDLQRHYAKDKKTGTETVGDLDEIMIYLDCR